MPQIKLLLNHGWLKDAIRAMIFRICAGDTLNLLHICMSDTAWPRTAHLCRRSAKAGIAQEILVLPQALNDGDLAPCVLFVLAA